MSREIFEQVQRCTSGTASSCFSPEVASSGPLLFSEPACVSLSDVEAAGLRQVLRGGSLRRQGDDERAHTRSHSSLSSGNNLQLSAGSGCFLTLCACAVPAGAAAPGRPGLHPQHGLFAVPGRQVRRGLQDVHLSPAADGISAMYVGAAQGFFVEFDDLEDGTATNIHLVSLPVFLCVAPSALSYNIALCHYSLKNYNQAVKYIEEIIERGIREHPGAAVL